MAIPALLRNGQPRQTNWLSLALLLASLVLGVGILYWAREVLIPIALAILLTFILSPIVTVLRRRGLGRAPAVLVTVVLTFVLMAAFTTVIVVEFQHLANELPTHRQNIRKKTLELRSASKGGAIEKVQNTIQEVIEDVEKETPRKSRSNAVPVVITGERTGNQATPIIEMLVKPLGTGAFVIVLSVFMLLRREDLRDRLLRLAGYGRLAATTKAIDEAGRQVSRYLLRQSLLNAGYGLAMGVGLFFIGVPYSILWGVLAAVARFVPYVGPWVGALAPILMSLAALEGWTAPLLVTALVICLELVCNMFLEPVLYGQSIGVSEVALLIMMAFWTWLWGPIGLVLSAPLTVCLMVLSDSVPDLEFINLLLNSKPALEPRLIFYQRLIARDPEDAAEIACGFVKRHSTMGLFEDLFIPALASCRIDRARKEISEDEYQYILEMVHHLVREHAPAEPETETDPAVSGPNRRILVVGCPANDRADEIALTMLAALLPRETWEMRVLAAERLVSENIQEVLDLRPRVICLGFLPGRPLFAVRQFCKRIRSANPRCPVVAGVWGAADREAASELLAGLVDAFGASLAEARNQVVELGQIRKAAESTRGRRPTVERSAKGPRRSRGERLEGSSVRQQMQAAILPAMAP